MGCSHVLSLVKCYGLARHWVQWSLKVPACGTGVSMLQGAGSTGRLFIPNQLEKGEPREEPSACSLLWVSTWRPTALSPWYGGFVCWDDPLDRHLPGLGWWWELLLQSCKRISASQIETRSNSPKELGLEEQQERRGKEMVCEGCVKDKWEMMSNNSINYKRS